MTQPNVVVIIMDTARRDAVYREPGGDRLLPTLSTVASEGVRFENAYAPAPWTLPSHASLFTGLYPSSHGVDANHVRLGDHLRLLPEALRSAGYETIAVSNNTWISEEFGFGRGFEDFHRTWQYVQSDTDLGRVNREYDGLERFAAAGRKLLRGNPIVNVLNAVYGQFFRKRRDSGAARTNRVIAEWLDDRNGARPFFLFVNYLEPHLEYRPPEAYAAEYLPNDVSYQEAMDLSQDAWSYLVGRTELDDRDFAALEALYRGEVAYLDHRIGELRDDLASRGLWEDTLVIVTSDHGENIGDHGLMDHQYCLYDTVLRVPLIVRGGPFGGGAVDDSLVQLTDVAPTLLEAIGVEDELEGQSQGYSFHPGSAGGRSEVVAEYRAPQPSMDALEAHLGDLPEGVRRFDRSLRAIRTDEYKLIRGSDGSRELYRITGDPDESIDVADAEPGTVDRLDARLTSWHSAIETDAPAGNATIPEELGGRLEDLGYLR